MSVVSLCANNVPAVSSRGVQIKRKEETPVVDGDNFMLAAN